MKNNGNMAELVEDISLIVDVVATLIAVIFGSLKMGQLSNIFFGLSGFGLVSMLISMIIKRIQRKKSESV